MDSHSRSSSSGESRTGSQIVIPEPIRTAVKARDTGNVVNLMDALRKSLSRAGKSASQPAKSGKPKKASGQREMLMAISGKGEAKSKGAAKETKRPTRQRKTL